jgi:predicted nucleotidyltransferase
MNARMFPIKTNVRPVGFPPVAETLPGAIDRIVSTLKPEKIILFGSYAYGNPTRDSDVDLLVIMNTKAKEVDRYVTVSNLLYPRQFPVDILVKTPKEIEAETKKKSNFFLREILKKGKVLYERSR